MNKTHLWRMKMELSDGNCFHSCLFFCRFSEFRHFCPLLSLLQPSQPIGIVFAPCSLYCLHSVGTYLFRRANKTTGRRSNLDRSLRFKSTYKSQIHTPRLWIRGTKIRERCIGFENCVRDRNKHMRGYQANYVFSPQRANE